ncbi:hypothetical protein AV656_08580 [Bhargavaea cecembensis]|uniref:Knr4/Smi1-like domain-containing protein n=1 Tax=Bhargavaea cecembensis TaxID=394098 RepID=A0A165H6S4_9BACL|nr:SMI1/KNR4 family protein [Bhargavaea cecembensis]KZE38945.1 hypothetical protein AV656_08580 [Bhargavaea cecembensis]
MDPLKQRYINLYPDEGTSDRELEEIEKTLNIRLPITFREISAYYNGGLLGGISHFSIPDDRKPNVKDETLRLRKTVGLPSRFVVLAEPPESLIVMDTSGTPEVIWLDAMDVTNLAGRTFTSPPDVWETYGEFFETLLAEEEEEREY